MECINPQIPLFIVLQKLAQTKLNKNTCAAILLDYTNNRGINEYASHSL